MPEKPQPRPNKQDENRASLAAAMMPETVNDELRTVDVVFFTGIDVPRYDYWKGEPYILRFNLDGADLAMLNGGAPVFDNHDSYGGAAAQMGVVEKGWRDGSDFKASLRFSPTPDVDNLWTKVKSKIVQKFSMGVNILEKKELAQEKGKLRAVEVTKWQPYEISTAPLPADFNTRTLSADGANEAVRATSPQESGMPDETTATGTARTETTTDPVNADAILKAERARTAALNAAHGNFLKLGGTPEMLNLSQHLQAGTSVEEFRRLAFDKLAERAEETPTRGHAAVTRDERATLRACAGEVITHMFDRMSAVDPANDFRGMSVLRLAEELLTRSGKRVRSKAEVAELSMHATADFPLILADSARKQMLAAYAVANPSYRIWTKPSTSPDFKTMSRLRLSETPSFLKVPEGAQITLGTMTESREQYALATYGRGVSFTRQMLINDDLGAFNDLLTAFGQQAARLENKTVYAILTANAAMSDGTALFHADHGNLGTGVIANTALDAMFTAMAIQKGLDGSTVLNLTPKYLIVPVAKGTTAQTAMTASGNNIKASDQNWFAGRLTPVADAELDGSSTAIWYAAADPGVAPGIEYAHLEGAEGPQALRKENEDAILGVQIYMFMDFGAKAVDWRSLYKSTGQ